jgi:hypothetical protein
MTTSKRLFKINSQVRDYDIICEKLQNTPQSQFIPSLPNHCPVVAKKVCLIIVGNTQELGTENKE